MKNEQEMSEEDDFQNKSGEGSMEDIVKVPGVCGLRNIGNTCYFNSALQCLMHCVELASYFLNTSGNNDWRKSINFNNPIGTKGELATAFGNLIKDLWSGNYSVISPVKLKESIDKFTTQFRGTQQQDAHELITFLLDGIHEDLNINRNIHSKLKFNSNFHEVITSNEINPEELKSAKETWTKHQSKNNSAIVDMFQGLLRSQIVCPYCSEMTTVFDPFMTLSLPLAKQYAQTSTIIFVPFDYKQQYKKLVVTYTHYSQVYDLVQEQLGYETDFVFAYRQRVGKDSFFYWGFQQNGPSVDLFALEILSDPAIPKNELNPFMVNQSQMNANSCQSGQIYQPFQQFSQQPVWMVQQPYQQMQQFNQMPVQQMQQYGQMQGTPAQMMNQMQMMSPAQQMETIQRFSPIQQNYQFQQQPLMQQGFQINPLQQQNIRQGQQMFQDQQMAQGQTLFQGQQMQQDLPFQQQRQLIEKMPESQMQQGKIDGSMQPILQEQAYQQRQPLQIIQSNTQMQQEQAYQQMQPMQQQQAYQQRQIIQANPQMQQEQKVQPMQGQIIGSIQQMQGQQMHSIQQQPFQQMQPMQRIQQEQYNQQNPVVPMRQMQQMQQEQPIFQGQMIGQNQTVASMPNNMLLIQQAPQAPPNSYPYQSAPNYQQVSQRQQMIPNSTYMQPSSINNAKLYGGCGGLDGVRSAGPTHSSSSCSKQTSLSSSISEDHNTGPCFVSCVLRLKFRKTSIISDEPTIITKDVSAPFLVPVENFRISREELNSRLEQYFDFCWSEDGENATQDGDVDIKTIKDFVKDAIFDVKETELDFTQYRKSGEMNPGRVMVQFPSEYYVINGENRYFKENPLFKMVSHIFYPVYVNKEFMQEKYNFKYNLFFNHIQFVCLDNDKIFSSETISLHKCFKYFSENEILDARNQWFCKRCQRHVNANKKMDVWSAPKILIIHLKRFVSCANGIKKVDQNVDYPEWLDMSEYLVGPDKNSNCRYKLFAVCEHFGGLMGGHYTAHALVVPPNDLKPDNTKSSKIYENAQWYYFNDSSVIKSSSHEAHSHNAYLLFYEKIE